MGLGRARDRALGLPAVTWRSRCRHGGGAPPCGGTTAAAALALALLAGCQSSAGGITGAVTGTATAAATANPALGAAVGIGTRALTDSAVRYVGRRWRRAEQDALAAQVGLMEVGESRPWRALPDLPVGGGKGGELRVLRRTETPLTVCKEVLFFTAAAAAATDSGDKAPAPRWFVTSACRQEDGWKWAAAEPATGRWDSLQ